MYCPNCKNEYRKGIEICPDCKIDLVEALEPDIEYTELFRAEDQGMVNEVARYFDHIGLACEVSTDEETAEIIFLTDAAKLKQAKMEAATVIKVYHEKKALEAIENPEETLEETEDENEEAEPMIPEKAFVSAKDRTSDYRSSGILFVIMGIILAALAVLNYVGKLSFIPARMSQIVFFVIGIACVIVGISSIIRSKSIQSEVKGEEEMVEKIKAAMAEKYPPQTFAEMMEDTDTTPELRYIQVQEEIKKYLASEFPKASSRMLDDFIEEYTDSMFS